MLLARDDISSGYFTFNDGLTSTKIDPRAATVFYIMVYEEKNERLEAAGRIAATSDHLIEDHKNLHLLWLTAVAARYPIFGSMVRMAIAEEEFSNGSDRSLVSGEYRP